MTLPDVLISADDHVTEPLDLWTTNLPPRLRDKGPRVEIHDETACLMIDDRVIRRFRRSGREDRHTGSALPDNRPGEAQPGSADPDLRLADLDRDGIWGEVIYPNLAFFLVHRTLDAELEAASCRVYNDWVADVFLGTSSRFCPVAILPALDLESCLAELERSARRGFRAVLLPCHADARPYNDPAYEPLWAAAEAHGLPLTFHAGTGRTQTPAHGPGAALVNYVVTVGCGPMETLAYLCGSGVLDRHPGLQVVFVEAGSGWLAWTLHAMDDAYRDHHAFVEPKLELLPSEYVRRQGHVTFQHDPVGLHNLDHTGERCLLWGADYPHPEGTWPHSRATLERQFETIPPEVTRRVVRDNAAELYGFPLAAPAEGR